MSSQNQKAEEHLKLAYHNYKFYCEVNSKLPSHFADWKITILFYTTIHLLRSYLADKGIIPEGNHHALAKALDPKKNPGNGVKYHCYNSYLVLYNASHDVRYTGFLDESKRSQYVNNRLRKCEKALESIDAFMVSKKYSSILPIQEEFDFN